MSKDIERRCATCADYCPKGICLDGIDNYGDPKTVTEDYICTKWKQ